MPDKAEFVDFRFSHVVTQGPENAVRFAPESRCVIDDETNGVRYEYVQCASCKSEHTFSDDRLFMENNYDFVPVFGPNGKTVCYVSSAYHQDGFKRIAGEADGPLRTWGKPSIYLRLNGEGTLLQTDSEVIEAAQRGAELVGQTIFVSKAQNLRVQIDYPIKTINTRREGNHFQVDTGPIVVPEIDRRHGSWEESLRLAYIAFNRTDRCEIIALAPVNLLRFRNPGLYRWAGRIPLLDRLFTVEHYWQIEPLDCVNSIFALV